LLSPNQVQQLQRGSTCQVATLSLVHHSATGQFMINLLSYASITFKGKKLPLGAQAFQIQNKKYLFIGQASGACSSMSAVGN